MNSSGTSSESAASQADFDRYFKKPEPSRTFGPVGPPDPRSRRPRGYSRHEIEDQQVIDRAMAIEDPWAGEKPPLYSPPGDMHEKHA